VLECSCCALPDSSTSIPCIDMSFLLCIFRSFASLGSYSHNLSCSAGACSSSSSRQEHKESQMPQQQKPTAVFSRVLQELRGQQQGQTSSQGQGRGTHQVSTTATQAVLLLRILAQIHACLILNLTGCLVMKLSNACATLLATDLI